MGRIEIANVGGAVIRLAVGDYRWRGHAPGEIDELALTVHVVADDRTGLVREDLCRRVGAVGQVAVRFRYPPQLVKSHLDAIPIAAVGGLTINRTAQNRLENGLLQFPLWAFFVVYGSIDRLNAHLKFNDAFCSCDNPAWLHIAGDCSATFHQFLAQFQ
ncbi:hypothetical protein ILFOPFJJ_05819 [Ensifer psoraleae]|nr:hypothetical protein [Sinorhizobium psoraleae]